MSPSTWDDGDTGTKVVINGTNKGPLSSLSQYGVTTSGTNGAVIRSVASHYGVKNFSVYVDGRKFYTEQAGDQFPPTAGKLEIVAKDSRGIISMDKFVDKSTTTEPTETPATAAEPSETDQGDEQPEPVTA